MPDIINLGKREDLLKEVTDWLWKEWGNGRNYSFFEDLVRHCLNEDDIPQMYIALLNNEAVGVVGLWRNDLKSRQDLFPWLSALYVCEAYRNRGIGTQLQNLAIKKTRELGYDNLYLFTELKDYYEKSGWEYIDNGMTYEGETVRIYKMKLKQEIGGCGVALF